MSKENETLENLIDGNDSIADVSNCAFNEVINEFRQWQKQWDLYDKREVLKKPQFSDAFIKRLKNKYVIGFKHCC